MTMQVLRRLDDLRGQTARWRAAGRTVGLVPTMGALHQGHLSLVKAARGGADRVIVTIFVNPRQFNNPEDLAKYPKSEAEDLALLSPLGVDLVYVPAPDQIYPEGFATTVSVAGLSEGLCGAGRPGHFDGVATVVTKLLTQTGADRAWFGEKDWQQLQIVRRLVADLDLGTEIVGCPTVREADGLAMASRNRRLSPAARGRAPILARALGAARDAIVAGPPAEEALAQARAMILADGFEQVEYLELRSASDLRPLTRIDRPARLFVAAHIDGIRLIDNIDATIC